MKRILLLSALLVTACAQPPVADDHSMHSEPATDVSSADRLNDSSRHQEWVEVQNGEKTIHTFVVYPETSENVPVVLVIHENRGLNDWARNMADQIAEQGYIAVAPDMLSAFDDARSRTSDFASDDERTQAINALDPAEVQADLQAVAEWAKTIPASDGTLVSAGFCWGGAQAYRFAATSDDLAASMVFYGTGPTDPAVYPEIDAPVYGFYGGADARVNATIPQSQEAMSAAGKTYEYEIYEGAGHAFMRSGEDPAGDPANVAAREAAWQRMLGILSSL